MVWSPKNEGLTLVGKIAYYGVFWFLYGTRPKHAAPHRASWSRYLYFRETRPYSHRMGQRVVSATRLVADLQRERAAWTVVS